MISKRHIRVKEAPDEKPKHVESHIINAMEPPDPIHWFPAMGFEGLSRSTRAGRPAPPYHQPTDPELVGTGILPGEDFQLASLAVAHPTRGSQLRSSLLTSNANPRFLVDPAMAPDHEAKRAVSSSSSFRVRTPAAAVESRGAPPLGPELVGWDVGGQARGAGRLTAEERDAMERRRAAEAREHMLGDRDTQGMGRLTRRDLMRVPHAVQHALGDRLPALPGREPGPEGLSGPSRRLASGFDNPKAQWEASLRWSEKDQRQSQFNKMMGPTHLAQWLDSTPVARTSSAPFPHQQPAVHAPTRHLISAGRLESEGLTSPTARVSMDEQGHGLTMRPQGGWAKSVLFHESSIIDAPAHHDHFPPPPSTNHIHGDPGRGEDEVAAGRSSSGEQPRTRGAKSEPSKSFRQSFKSNQTRAPPIALSKSVSRKLLTAERLKATAMQYASAQATGESEWDLLQEEAAPQQPVVPTYLTAVPLDAEDASSEEDEAKPGKLAAGQGWKAMRRAVNAHATVMHWTKSAANAKLTNEPDFSQVSVMWVNYTPPEERPRTVMPKASRAPMNRPPTQERAQTAPSGKMRAGDEAIQMNFRGLRRKRITALVGGSRGASGGDPMVKEEYRMAIVRNMDVQCVIDKLLALQSARRVATALLRMEFELVAVLLATIANMGLVTRVGQRQQWSKSTTRGSLRKLGSDKEGMELVAETLGKDLMPPVCAGKVLIHMEPEMAATLMELLPPEERDEIEAAILAGPSLTQAAMDVYLHIRELPLDNVVAGILKLKPALAAEVVNLCMEEWDDEDATDLFVGMIVTDRTRSAVIASNLNPQKVAYVLNVVDDRVMAVASMVPCMSPERASSVLEQMTIPMRAVCLQNLERRCAVACVVQMEFRKAAEACCNMHQLNVAAKILSEAEAEAVAVILQEVCEQSVPPGKRAADLLSAMTATKGAAIVLRMNARSLEKMLREAQLLVLIEVVQCMENDEAAAVTSSMDTKKLVQLMAALPAFRGAGVLEQMKQETIAAVVTQMPKENSAQVLQRMGAAKAVAPFEVLSSTESAAILCMMTCTKATTILTCMHYVKAAGLLQLMPLHLAAPMLDLLPSEMGANCLHEILPQRAAGLMNKMRSLPAAVVLTKMDTHKAVQMLHGIDAHEAAAMVANMDTDIAAKLLNKLEEAKTSFMLEEMDARKAALVAEKMEATHIVNTINQMNAEKLANMLFQMENVKRAAWMLENVLVHHCTAVIQSLDITKAAAIVSLMKAESSGVAMEKVETDRSAEVLAEVESAQAGAVLHIMDAVRAGQILSKIPIEHASAVVVFMGADEAAAAVQKLDKLNVSNMLSLSDENMTVDIFNKMDVESAGEIMACMSASKAASLQSGMSKNSGEQAASVLEIVMNSEEELAVDILRELDEVSASKVLMGMQPECAGQLAMKIDAEMMGGRFRHMSPEKIGIVVVEMDPDKAWLILKYLEEEQIAQVLKSMDPSFSAQLLEFMDTNTGCKVLSNMDAKDTGEIVHHAQGEHAARILDIMPDNFLQQMLSSMHGNRAARVLDYLEVFKAIAVLLLMSAVRGAEYLSQMRAESGGLVVSKMPKEKAGQLLNNMQVNKAGILVHAMDPDSQQTLLKYLGADTASRFMKAGRGQIKKQ